MEIRKKLSKENFNIEIFQDETSARKASAEFVARHLNEAIRSRGSANLILATGASQFAFLEAFKKLNIDWNKITAFHLDEYKDLPKTHLVIFRKYLKERIVTLQNPSGCTISTVMLKTWRKCYRTMKSC